MLIFRATRSSSLRSIPLRTTQVINFSSDDKNQPPSTQEPPKETSQKNDDKSGNQKLSAADRLNKLLASMNTDDKLTMTKKVEIPQAGGRKQAKEKSKEEKQNMKKEEKSKDILEAVKMVAKVNSINEAQNKQTESELLAKLLRHIDGGVQITETSSDAGPEHKNLTEMSLNDLIVGMKIDRDTKPTGSSSAGGTMPRSQFVRNNLSGKQFPQKYESRNDSQKQQKRKRPMKAIPHTGSVNLFGDEPLGIFKDPSVLRDGDDLLPTWTQLDKRELKLAVTHPPKNYFDKMSLWTEQGKVWKFPIDNEQGLESEALVDFSEHVFLDQHLEGWCPDKGPIRHFMELVCVGLSKNPYITAAEKKEHILWYRDYFDKKKEILNELIGQQKDTKSEQKSVSSS